METMRELYDEGMLSTRAFYAVKRGIYRYFSDRMHDKGAASRISSDLADHLTVKELFEMFGEECIRGFKNLGDRAIEELKGLL